MTYSFYGSDPKKRSDIWLTPPSLVHALGKFDLDPCSPNDLPWRLADKFYSLENGEDGLTLPWHGRIWLNPPYSNWSGFARRLMLHGNGICLMFARTETKSFFEYVWNGADAILFIRGRIKFVDRNLKKGLGATAPSVLIAYGQNNVESLEMSGISGHLVYLTGKKRNALPI